VPPAQAPEAVVTPPQGHPRFPLFDPLRALAAISILLIHVAIFSGALGSELGGRFLGHLDIGVTIFFLLSGFLLYRPFVAARVLGARDIRLRDYARRRFLRIAPAYWLALTVLAVFPGLDAVFSGDWWVYYGLLQNYPVYTPAAECASLSFGCGIAPAWSLAVEIGFYALLPFFALGMARLTSGLRGRRWPWVEVCVLAALGAVSAVIQASDLGSDASVWLFFSPLGRAWWFGLGMALAVLSVRVQEIERTPRAVGWVSRNAGAIWGLALALYVLAGLILPPGPSLAARVGVSKLEYVGEYLAFGLIAALVLLPAIFGDERSGLPRRVLGHRSIAWLGLISYGIFLWHYPIVLGLVEGDVLDWWPGMEFPVLAVTTLAITVACAALSYYLLERPLMRHK
jgi:peptidoglycan/LPS O-acetylase OafA/YrhL